jgi:hypothetical protein
MAGIRVKTDIQLAHLEKDEDVRVLTNTNCLSSDTKGKAIWISDIKGEVGINSLNWPKKRKNP